MLAGDSGGFVLPGESAQMAHRAEHLRRLRPARRDLSGIGPEAGPARRLCRIVLGEIEHVLARKGGRDRRHDGVLTSPMLEVPELQVGVARGLRGQDWNEPH